MFWKFRGSKDDEEIKGERVDSIELPPIEDLENWVVNLIVKLKLKPGEYTFLPAYGGILLFIRNEGIAWLTYSEIKEALGEVDKKKLADSTVTLGGVAVGASIGASIHAVWPFLVAQRMVKGSYQVFAKPSPKSSMSFLRSMIDKVIIEEKKIQESLLNTFEEVPYKSEKPDYYSTYAIRVKRKFLDKDNESMMIKFLKGVMTFISGSKDPIFVIPPQADVKAFASILETHDIIVVWKKDDEIKELTDGNDYEISESQ